MYEVYKVVRIENDGRLSSACCRNSFPDKFRVYYKVGVNTKPNIKESMLFAFTDLEEAKDFADNFMEPHAIYLAHATKLFKNIKPQNIGYYNVFKSLNDFWKKLYEAKKNKKRMDKVGTPMRLDYKSTVCCPSLKLIKELHV